ncbi:MAG: RidA family protein [Edaphobacter sp.]
MSEVERISVEDAPSPKGAYSQAVRAGDFLFVSGQGPIDPATGKFVFSDIRGETQLTLKNIERILASCGAGPNHIVKCGVFLAKAEDFGAMNEVYGAFFSEGAPTRTTVQSVLMDPGMKVEIDCIAYLPRK